MGQQSSLQVNRKLYDEEEFEAIQQAQNDFRYGKISVLQSKKDQDYYLALLRKAYVDEMIWENAVEETKIRFLLEHPNLVKLVNFNSNKDQGNFCSQGYSINHLYEYYTKDLSSEIRSRELISLGFREDELWYLFTSLIEVCTYLCQKYVFHADIRPSTIFLSDEGFVKLGELFGAEHNSAYYLIMGGITGEYYISPQLLRELSEYKESPQKINEKSTVFSIGMVMLHAATLKNVSNLCYDREKYAIKWEAVEELLSQVKSQYSEILTNSIRMCLIQEEIRRCSLNELTNVIKQQMGTRRIVDRLSFAEVGNVQNSFLISNYQNKTTFHKDYSLKNPTSNNNLSVIQNDQPFKVQSRLYYDIKDVMKTPSSNNIAQNQPTPQTYYDFDTNNPEENIKRAVFSKEKNSYNDYQPVAVQQYQPVIYQQVPQYQETYVQPVQYVTIEQPQYNTVPIQTTAQYPVQYVQEVQPTTVQYPVQYVQEIQPTTAQYPVQYVQEVQPSYVQYIPVQTIVQPAAEQVQYIDQNLENQLVIPNGQSQVYVQDNQRTNVPSGGFFDYETVIDLYQQINKLHPNVTCPLVEIGKTEENRSMHSTCITYDTLNNQQGVFINSLHHAREVLSLSMQVYTYANLLYKYLSGNPETINLLKNNVIWFVPAVNVDGYEYLKQNFNTHRREYIRKNRKVETKCNNDYQNGIDLNRNYPTAFGIDEIGSTNDPCDEIYRGEYPFSAKETANIKSFLDKRNNIKVALNLHSFGNMWIIPFNYLNDRENTPLKKMKKEYAIYNEFYQQASFSSDARKGNAAQTINYVANGEASDWMLKEKHIIALSPEIGFERDEFFPPQSNIVKALEINLSPIIHIIHKMNAQFQQYYIQKIYFNQKKNRLQQTGILDKLQTSIILLKQQKKLEMDNQIDQNLKLNSAFVEIYNSGIADIQGNNVSFKFKLFPQGGDVKNSNLTVHKILNVYYDDVYKAEQLREMDLQQFQSLIIDKKALEQSQFTTIQENTHQFNIEQVKGRTLYQFFVLFTHNLPLKNQIKIEVQVNEQSFDQQNLILDFEGISYKDNEFGIEEIYKSKEFITMKLLVIIAILLFVAFVLFYTIFCLKRQKYQQLQEETNNKIEIQIN